MSEISGTFSKPVAFVRAFVSQYAPWLSLAIGVLARVLSNHDINFAPKAVALLIVAWTLPAVFARVLPSPQAGVKEPKWRNVIRTTGAPFVVVALYKNVLFFLVPIWFGSAHIPSVNMGAPLVLAAMALFTCFSHQYHHHVIEHPVRRVVWSAVVLFAALVPALAVLAFMSPRLSLFFAALLATAIATASLKGGANLLSHRAVIRFLWSAMPVALLVAAAAPLLPPVPAVCHDEGAGTALLNHNLVNQANSFPKGTRRVYAWFAVSLPAGYRQRVAFQWFHNGKKVGGPIPSRIEGGRSTGYRTATYKTAPAVGHWRAELYSDASQLVARVSFEIEP